MTTGPSEVSSKILAAVRDFAYEKLPEPEGRSLFEDVLRGLNLSLSQVDAVDAWFPLDALTSLRKHLAPALGENVIEQALLWGVPRRREFSAMSLPALATPQRFYRHIARSASFLARHLHFETLQLDRGYARFAMHYAPGVPRERDSCDVARACLACVPMLQQLPHAKIREQSCYVRGDSHCEYEVRWRELPNYAATFGLWGGLGGVLGAMVVPSFWWVGLPVISLLAGRELYLHHAQRYTIGVLSDQRRALHDNEFTFQRHCDELAELNKTLELRVRARAAQLSYARDGLRRENRRLRRAMTKLDQLQDELVDAGLRGVLGQLAGDFAHEVNNPLSSLNISLSVLEVGMPQPDEGPDPLDASSTALRSMQREVERIRKQVAWFVEEHQKQETAPSPLDLEREIHATVNLVTRVHNREGTEVHLVLCKDAWIEAFGRQPVQVITTLLTNALRAAAGGNVWLFTERIGQEIVMRVADDGVGMTADETSLVFDRGYTGHADTGGSGMGLFVARAIVARHGGRILVESAPNEGTTFTVHWPASDAPSQPAKVRAGDHASHAYSASRTPDLTDARPHGRPTSRTPDLTDARPHGRMTSRTNDLTDE